MVVLGNLLLSQHANVLDWVEAGVFSESHWDFFKSIGECSYSVLLHALNLVSLLGHSNGAGHLGGATAAHDVVILDHVPHDTDGVVETSLGLVTNGLASSAHHDGNSLGEGAILDQDDFVTGGSEGDLLDGSSVSKFFWRDLLESWDDLGLGGDGEELNLHTSNPTDGWKLVLHQEMVGLIIESPLAEDDVGAGFFDARNHVDEVVLLHLLQFLVVSGALDLQTVLGLWLGWLKWASQDTDLGISDLLLHLRVRELFVEDDTLNKLRIFDGTSSLHYDLDQIEVDISSLHIGDVEHGSDGEVSEVVLTAADDLGAESGLGALSQILVVVLCDVQLLLDGFNLGHGNVASALKSIGNFERMDSLFQKFLGLLKNGTGQNNDTSGSISNLVVLRSGELSQ